MFDRAPLLKATRKRFDAEPIGAVTRHSILVPMSYPYPMGASTPASSIDNSSDEASGSEEKHAMSVLAYTPVAGEGPFPVLVWIILMPATAAAVVLLLP